MKSDEIIQDILDKKIPINDINLFHKAFDILSQYGDNVKKNDTQIWLALMRFESELVQCTDKAQGSRMSELVQYVNRVWVKKDSRLDKNNGKVVKPFEGIYQNARGNVWRNPLGTQKGISCFAPTGIISDVEFVEEDRVKCEYRIAKNKCKFSPKTTCNPYKYPKLLQISPTSKRAYDYKKTEWTNNTIRQLLKDETKKIPLVPIIIILYFGADSSITKNRSEVTIQDFQEEFNFSTDTLLQMFDVFSSIGSSDGLGIETISHEDFEEIEIISSKPKTKSISKDNQKRTNLLEREIDKFPSIAARSLPREEKVRMYYVDEIIKEQASNQHKRIVSIFAKFFYDRGITAFEKGRADLVAIVDTKAWLLEMKSITDNNQIKQTRSAIGQLFDYEFMEMRNYRLDHDIVKAIAFEKKPTDHIIKLLQFIGIHIFWLTDSGDIAGDEKSSKYLNQIKYNK